MSWLRISVLCYAIGFSHAALAEVALQNLRTWHAPDRSRLVFDLSKPIEYKVFTLGAPDRLVMDLHDAVFRGRFPTAAELGPFATRLRMARHSATMLRFVLDLRTPVVPRSFLLAPNAGYGHRLVIDLERRGQTQTPKSMQAPRTSGVVTVAIDPGHGGEDPGARGRRGTREKDVVLAIAKELYRRINATPNMRAILSRNGDYYVSLRRRTEIARKHNADLFVSLHADAFPQRSVRGSSVYALSARGATSETARWLADKENASDLAGGVSINDKDDTLAQVLLDLSMTKTIEHSLEFGQDVLAALARIGPVHNARIEQAGFVVLKSPDIPSVLVEIAYISNPDQERQLASRKFQQRVAGAIRSGIERYVQRNPRRFATIPSRSSTLAGGG